MACSLPVVLVDFLLDFRKRIGVVGQALRPLRFDEAASVWQNGRWISVGDTTCGPVLDSSRTSMADSFPLLAL